MISTNLLLEVLHVVRSVVQTTERLLLDLLRPVALTVTNLVPEGRPTFVSVMGYHGNKRNQARIEGYLQ
jgi:hypothetical protein